MLRQEPLAASGEPRSLRVSPPAWMLWCLASFGVWQMGVVFYGSSALAVRGRAPLPIDGGLMLAAIAAGYIVSFILMLLRQQKCVLIARVCLILSLAVSAALFFPLPENIAALLFCFEAFLCVFFIGVIMAASITLLEPETALRYCIFATVLCGVFVPLLQSEALSIPFSVFNAVSLIAAAVLLAVFLRLPSGVRVSFERAGSAAAPPRGMLFGFYAFIALSSLMTLFGSGIAEGFKYGVSVYYAACGAGGLFFLLLWRKRGLGPMQLTSSFLVAAGVGFLLSIAASYYPWLGLPACFLMGFGLLACSLCEFFSALLFVRRPSRAIVPAIIAIALADVLVHSFIIQMLRGDAVRLGIVCSVAAVAGLMLYLRLEPKLTGFFTPRAPGAPPPDAAPDAFAAEGEPSDAFAALSPRERMLAGLIIRGFTMKDISEQMGIELSTQRTYRKNLYSKLGVHSRSELYELSEAKPALK